RYTYDVCGNVMKEEQFIESIELDSKMLANKAKEIQAVQYEFSQDAFHNITKQIEANGDVLELQYKPNTNLCIERHFTAKGGISRRGVSFYNDDASLVIESIDENGKGRAWTYAPKSFVLGKGDEEIIEEKWVDFTAKKTMLIKKVRTLFNAQGNPYKKEVFGSDGLLATTELFEYDARGRCISNTNPLGVTVTSSYDVNNNRSRISHQSTRETVCFDYDLDDRLVTTTQQFQDRKSVKSRTEYDAYGRCIATIDRYGNRIDYIFDPTGHLVCMKKPAVVAANGSSQRYETSFERDFTPSRLVLSDHAAIDMADIFSPYRESGTTCDTLWRPIRVQKMVDNKVAIFECKKYDAIGQVVQEWIEQPDGTIILEKFHEYDGFGNIVKVTTASGVEVRKFIEGDRVELITNPQGRSIVIEYDDTQTNQLGQFVLTKRVIEPSGRVVQVQYDSLEREAMRLCFDAGNTLLSKKEYFYDMKDHITAMVDSLCGPTGIITGQVRTEYLYDGEGELVKVKQAAGTPLERVMELKDPADAVSEVAPYVVRCEKDNLGRVTKLLLPDHSFIQYCYKGLFQSAVVRYSATGQELYRHEFTEYSKQGLAAKENVIGKGGVKTTTYNAMGQVSQITQPEFTQTVLEWDADGQPAIVEKNGIQMVLQFDGLGRLIREKSSRNIALQYDSQGNILKFGVRKFNYDILNQIQRENGTFYSYNTYGDLAEIKNSNTLKKFSYDPSYRLSAYIEKDSTVTFGYDAFDNRVRRRVGDTVQYYLYVDDTEIGAVDSKGCIVELKVPQSIIDGEVTGCVAIELKDGKVYRPTVDLFGNIAALHDAKTNKLVESYEYTGFGQEQIFNAAQERFDDSPVGNAWRFQAARKDPLTGFLWWCGRDYCTDTGRFINPDRNALIQGINPFHFPDNNPFQIMEVELET
ncbi:MAG TPA: hypothetical protein VN457_05065, partial [Chlamydiales bacterium]|nr:hypothetical protein [Chlamydiales bacterium]